MKNSSPPFSRARWISASVVGGPRTCAPAPYLRKEFFLAHPTAKAVLSITALGLYETEINGIRVGDEVFTPGWTNYRKRVQFQQFDVTKLLHQGENAMGVILGDGWYCGFVAWRNRQIYGDQPVLLAQLEVQLRDGATVIVATDSTWKTTTGPILENDFLVGESYDARLELGRWSEAGYDDRQWGRVAAPASEPEAELSLRTGPPVRRINELMPLKPVENFPRNPERRQFDFGQNFSGRIRIKVKTSRGTTLTIRYAEILKPDGSLYTENLRSIRAADIYTAAGNGEEIWEPRFTFHGFRHVEILGPLGETDILEVTGIVLHSDTPSTGIFRCSNELLNQLQHNIVWGQKSNFIEVPTDCPQRNERLGWTGDAQVFIRTAAFNMDVRPFFHKWIQDIRDAQSPRGAVPAVIPNEEFIGQEEGGPAWSDATIICPWTIYLCYGDCKILADHYDSMKRYLDFLGSCRCQGFLRSLPETYSWTGFGDWLALDGSGNLSGGTPHDLIGTAFYAYDASIMAQVAVVLGHSLDAEKYRLLNKDIVAAFQRRYITPDGLVASGTQTAYVLALHFGLIEESKRAFAAQQLVRDIKKRGYHLATGFVGTPYLLEVLEANNYLDVAYKLLEQETFPSWLFPVKNGATTIWERWDGWTPDKGFSDPSMNSFNHYAYGAVGAWMYRSVAGLELDPAEPGYRHIIFRPRPGGSISWAEASLKTAYGVVALSWKLAGAALEITFTVPNGCHATFIPAPEYQVEKTDFSEGTHKLTACKR